MTRGRGRPRNPALVTPGEVRAFVSRVGGYAAAGRVLGVHPSTVRSWCDGRCWAPAHAVAWVRQGAS